MLMNKIMKYLVIIVASVAMFEVFSSVFLKVYVRCARNVNSEADLTPYWEYDPYLLWIPRKNANGYDKDSTFKMNNHGFRNSYDVMKEKKEGIYRIVVLGGSTSWGSGASSNDTVWTAVLEEILRKKYPGKVEVLNACCSGYTSFQELVYLQFKLLGFSPDAVIVLDGYNDIFMAARYPEDKYRDNVSVYYEAKKRFFCAGLFTQMMEVVKDKSSIYALAERLREKIRYERGQPLFGKLYVHRKGIDNYLDNMKNISDTLTGKKIKALFLLQPYMGLSKKPRSPGEEKMFAKNARSNDIIAKLIGMLRERYRGFASGSGIIYRDLTDIYDTVPSSDTVWHDHIHLNDEGHRILAENVADILLKEGFLNK